MSCDEFFIDELKALNLENYGFKLELKPRSYITDVLMKQSEELGIKFNGAPIFDGYFDAKNLIIYISNECENKKNAIAHEVRHAFQFVQMAKLRNGDKLDDGITDDIVEGWITDKKNNQLSHNKKRNEQDAYNYADNKYPRNRS
jgi:hypothetical protein